MLEMLASETLRYGPCRFEYLPALPICFSKLNGRVGTIASRLSEARSEREVSLFIHEFNRSVDENRGVAKPDFLRHFWEEEKLRLLISVNVDGPAPGGNLMIPPEVMRRTVDARCHNRDSHLFCSARTP